MSGNVDVIHVYNKEVCVNPTDQEAPVGFFHNKGNSLPSPIYQLNSWRKRYNEHTIYSAKHLTDDFILFKMYGDPSSFYLKGHSEIKTAGILGYKLPALKSVTSYDLGIYVFFLRLVHMIIHSIMFYLFAI